MRTAVTFITGHSHDSGVPGREPDWRALAAPGTTAVFYMGLARLDRIVARLLEHGAPGTRPAALIAQASTAQQRVVAATLESLGAARAREELESPALLVVGDVAALHASLAWFKTGGAEIDLSQSA